MSMCTFAKAASSARFLSWRNLQRAGRPGGFLRALQRELRAEDHVDSRRAQRRDDRRRHLGIFQHVGGKDGSAVDVDRHLARQLDRLLLHVRGIARKPGGWRLPVTNIVMGPPIFAPLLFGVSAYLGLIASFLRPEEAPEIIDITPGSLRGLRRFLFGRRTPWTQEIREGRFQKHLAVATILSSFFSGFEALYSHYKNNFKYKAQWSPVIIAPLLMLSAALSMRSPRAARTVLPIASVAAIVDDAESDFITTRAAFFAGREDRRIFFITSSMGRLFLRRCFLPPAVCLACWRA